MQNRMLTTRCLALYDNFPTRLLKLFAVGTEKSSLGLIAKSRFSARPVCLNLVQGLKIFYCNYAFALVAEI